jgi:hypothetical protein
VWTVGIVAYKRPPSFVAAYVAASGGHVLASFFVGLVFIPFALVTWSGLALSRDPSTASFGLLLASLLVLAAQPFVAAWIAQQGLSLFNAGNVTYARACGAMALGLVVTILSALVLPAEAAFPGLGYAWTGAAAAALILAAQPKTSSASP